MAPVQAYLTPEEIDTVLRIVMTATAEQALGLGISEAELHALIGKVNVYLIGSGRTR
jgi:hypothetical protein